MQQPALSHTRPVIGISCGDINGIGIELIIKSLTDSRLLELCTPVVFASNKVINFYRKFGFRHFRLEEGKEDPEVRTVAESQANKVFKTTLDAIQDPEFNAFLQMLIDRKLTKFVKCKDVWRCQEEGFLMTYAVD